MVKTAKKEAPEPLVYSIADTARLLGKSRDTVYKLIRDGEIDATRIGERPSVTAESIRRLFERNRVQV